MAHTGAMIALIPTDADAQRLAIDGGEDASELHVTLMYLGEAALIPVEIREALVNVVEKATRELPTITGKIFAVNVFNPAEAQQLTAGGDPCVVWGLEGQLLRSAHELVVPAVRDVFAAHRIRAEQQHEPWIPHITATYVTPDDEVDLAPFTYALGAVTFDRIRLAFGDDVYDISLGDCGCAPGSEVNDAVAAGFNPNQPRDAEGKWTDGSTPDFVEVGVGEHSRFGRLADGTWMVNLPEGWTEASKGTQGWIKQAIESGVMKTAPGKSPSTAESTELSEPQLDAPKPNEPKSGITEVNDTTSNLVKRTPTKRWPFSYEPVNEMQFDYGHLVQASDADYEGSGEYYLTRVPVSKLVPTQDPDDDEWGDAAEYGNTGKPVALDFGDGVFYLLDGHHRAMKAGQSGSLETWVRRVSITAAAHSSQSAQLDHVVDVKLDGDGHPITPATLLDWHTWFAGEQERDVNAPGGGHNLRNYWVHGPGAAKIGWGTDGSFKRCVTYLSKYVSRPQGLCAEYHKQATGEWPAEKGVPSSSDVVALDDESRYTTVDSTSSEGNSVVTVDATVTTATDPKMPYGDVEYADPGYQEDGVKRYPLDTEAHVRAAWSYINMPKNAAQYSRTDLRRVRARIAVAMKRLGVQVEAALAEDIIAAAIIAATSKKRTTTCEIDDVYAAEVMTPEITPISSASWNGVLTVEGVESGDGRMFATNGLTWDEPPLPLMWQKETSHGGDNNVSVRVGTINRIWREPAGDGDSSKTFIMGSGTLDLGSADGREVFRRMRDGYMGGNSVDVDSVKNTNVELRFPPSITDENGVVVQVFSEPDLTTYKCGRIRASTMVEIPAFTEAHLTLTDVTASMVPMSDVDDINAETTEIVAATNVIEITDAPPREWFNEPTDVTPQGALTITPQGRVYGYVAPAGVRHRSFTDRSQYVPLGKVDYTRFMSGETIVADGGRVTTGRITMNCGHATTRRSLTASKAAEHYDNSCSIVATVCVGENEHGVWMAGALLPDLTPATVQRMMACSLSGDWRAHLDKPGWREFVAALLVPVPGFPMARRGSSVELTDGELVASTVPVAFTREVDTVVASDAAPASMETGGDQSVVATLVRRVKVARLRGMVARVGER